MDLSKQMGLTDEGIIGRVKFTVQAEGAPRDSLEKIAVLAVEGCPGVECISRPVLMDVELIT